MPTGLVKLIGLAIGAIIGKALLDSGSKETPTPAQPSAPVVVNVHKRYITRKPKPRKKPRTEAAADSQNLEVASPSPEAGGAPVPPSELSQGENENPEVE